MEIQNKIMKNILLVDFSIYRDSLKNIFSEMDYKVELCDSAYRAMSMLKAVDFDLVISEVELPGDNAFDLYNYIKKDYPYIPVIMTTDKNIDIFFEEIFREGIGNVLCKPVKRDELVSLSEKLITKQNIFGLSNYLKDINDLKKIRITSSRQIQPAIFKIFGYLENQGVVIENKTALNLVLNEMLINAVYHSHDLTYEKEHRIPVKLDEGSHVDIFFALSDKKFGLSITDYNGKLTKKTILNSINKVIEQDQLILKAFQTGEDIIDKISETGRGLDLVRKMGGEYYFIIKENSRTEIVFLFEREYTDNDSEIYSSLKIIEDFTDR
jgi:CheY-like chemotaxis protein